MIIKTRLVRLQALSPGTLASHMRYLARDGITRKGERAPGYTAQQDQVDLSSFAAKGCGDRHQFRLIVRLSQSFSISASRSAGFKLSMSSAEILI